MAWWRRSVFCVIAKEWFQLTNAQIQSFIYLKLAVAGHLTLFVARTRQTIPQQTASRADFAGGNSGHAGNCRGLIVGFGWLVAPIAWKYVGFVWIYCLVWVFIEDWAKLRVYRHLELSTKRHRKFLEQIKTPLHSHPVNPNLGGEK